LHGDLKPDNILLASGNWYSKQSTKMVLIDFGISKTWQDENGKHIPFKKTNVFAGNLLFASRNAFLNKELSRRDDLISLCYLLVFLVNGALTWVQRERLAGPMIVEQIGYIKARLRVQDICVGQAKGLVEFCRECHSYKFDQ
jgi:serine/threonine protein kinase